MNEYIINLGYSTFDISQYHQQGCSLGRFQTPRSRDGLETFFERLDGDRFDTVTPISRSQHHVSFIHNFKVQTYNKSVPMYGSNTL